MGSDSTSSTLVQVIVQMGDCEFSAAFQDLTDIEAVFEQVVPIAGPVEPIVWIETADQERFQDALELAEEIQSFAVLGKQDERYLYQLTIQTERLQFFAAISAADGIVLAGAGTADSLVFDILFPSHDHASRFQTVCDTFGVECKFTRVTSSKLSGTVPSSLTDAQMETLELAFEMGYFDVPRSTTLGDIASELDVSSQAVSERLRRAIHTLLREEFSELMIDGKTDHSGWFEDRN